MKNKPERWNKRKVTEQSKETAHQNNPESERTNPYPWYPAIWEGKPGQIYISYIVVYYSLN